MADTGPSIAPADPVILRNGCRGSEMVSRCEMVSWCDGFHGDLCRIVCSTASST